MALTVHSKFYYGIQITSETKYLDFKEGAGPELTAELTVKGYTLEEIALEIETQLNAVGALTYTVTANRATRVITIAGSGNFTLLANTGTHVSLDAFPVIGFPATDTASATNHPGTNAVGLTYTPQFILQSYLPKTHNRRAQNAVVSKSASGKNVSVQSFGEERFIKFNIKYITDITQPSTGYLRDDPNAVDNVLDFLEWATSMEKFEFMEDENKVDDFSTVLLESLNGNADSTNYELRESYDQSLPYFYETGLIVLKVVD